MDNITCSCTSCEHHKSKANPTPGKLIPGGSGKCVRPEGLCEIIARQGEPQAADTPSEGPGSAWSQALIGKGAIQEAIASTARDPKHRGELCALAVSAMQDALNRADKTGETPTEDELCDVAVRAIVNSDRALVPEISAERGAELSKMQSDMALADKAVLDMAPVAEALGRIKTADFFRRVGDIIIAQAFTDLRNSKKYKDYPIMDDAGNIRRCQTIEDFCQCAFGKSYNRCYELAQNLHTLGSDLYESAERIGFRNKDYRALKALPPEDQETIKQAIASESRDEVLSILEDLAAKHQAEREAAKKEKADLAADLEARGKLLEDKAARLERTETELYKLKSLPPDEQTALRLAREEEAVKELNAAQMAALSGLNQFLLKIETILETPGISVQTSQYAVGLVQSWCESASAELADHGIPVDFENIITPEWLREAAQADLDGGRIAEPGAAGRSW